MLLKPSNRLKSNDVNANFRNSSISNVVIRLVCLLQMCTTVWRGILWDLYFLVNLRSECILVLKTGPLSLDVCMWNYWYPFRLVLGYLVISSDRGTTSNHILTRAGAPLHSHWLATRRVTGRRPRCIHWKCLRFWDTLTLNISTDTKYAWMQQTYLTDWIFISSV